MTATPEFKNINPELYRHPGEREALARLKKIPGFAKALDMLSEGSGGKAERQTEIASMLRVGPGVYPALAELWSDACGRFGLGEIPLHLGFNPPQPWSIRGGNEQPVVILSSRLLDELPEPEMEALLLSQAGLIRLGNATNLAAADFLRWLSDFSGIAGAPAAMLAWGIENWRRYAGFSADRAAALALGDPEAALQLLERISGGGKKAWGGITEPDRLRLQGVEALSLDRDWSNSRWRRFALAMNRQNHVGLIRRMDLLDWFASGEPKRILTGETVTPPPEQPDLGGPAVNADPDCSADPGLAYWGEFVNSETDAAAEPGAPGSDGDAKTSGAERLSGAARAAKENISEQVNELMGWAGKGFTSFWKAGEAFVKTFQEEVGKDDAKDKSDE
ncbi:MAG: hypothetical protein LIP23_06615 [Planctomycetes bacterium]|nr:hypothetical protein [Planctomycetota bacterium]